MSGERLAQAVWSRNTAKQKGGGRTAFSLEFKLGPFRLTQARYDLTAIDFGPTAISGEKVDIRFLPSDQTLFLRSVPDHLRLETTSHFTAMLVYRAYQYDRSWTVTEGSFESYLGSFSKTSRKGLKRRIKKLVERSGGRLDVRRFDRPQHMATFHQHARIVSAETFQEKLMDEGIPSDRSFLEAMRAKASDGRCYGTILYLDDQPISYLYCQRQANGWLAVYGGFDPAHAGLSPGTVHQLHELELLFDDPDCAFFDFGPGPSSYKQFFSTHDVPCSDLLILERTASNRLTIAIHRLLGSVTETGKQLAASLRLQDRIRQQIRGR